MYSCERNVIKNCGLSFVTSVLFVYYITVLKRKY